MQQWEPPKQKGVIDSLSELIRVQAILQAFKKCTQEETVD